MRFIFLPFFIFLSTFLPAQVDSFKVGKHYFYADGPADWDLAMEKDSAAFGYGDLNLVYRHPVNSTCTYAYMGTMVRDVNKEGPANPVSKKKKQPQSTLVTLEFRDIKGFTCIYYKDQTRVKKCRRPFTYCMYIYRVNDSLELVTSLLYSLDDESGHAMEDSLAIYTHRSFLLNKNRIRTLNPVYNPNPPVDSFFVNGRSVVFPVIAGWTTQRIFSEDTSDLEGKRARLVHEKETECNNAMISINLNVLRESFIRREVKLTPEEQYILSQLMGTRQSDIVIPKGLYCDEFSAGMPSRTGTHFTFSESNSISRVMECDVETTRYLKTYSVFLETEYGETWEIEFVMSVPFEELGDLIAFDESFKVFFAYVRSHNDFEALTKAK